MPSHSLIKLSGAFFMLVWDLSWVWSPWLRNKLLRRKGFTRWRSYWKYRKITSIMIHWMTSCLLTINWYFCQLNFTTSIKSARSYHLIIIRLTQLLSCFVSWGLKYYRLSFFMFFFFISIFYYNVKQLEIFNNVNWIAKKKVKIVGNIRKT